MATYDAFDFCANFTKEEEGGYTCSPEDSGNWSSGLVGQGRLIGSNMGISAPTLISWLGRDDPDLVDRNVMRLLSDTTYRAIARTRYWRSLACDNISPFIAMMIFDFGWNVGIGTSARLLQSVLGLRNDAVDGDLGPSTQKILRTPNWSVILDEMEQDLVRRLQSFCKTKEDGIGGPATISALTKQSELWPTAVALRLYQAQVEEYKRISNFKLYGKGWLLRTSKRLEAALRIKNQDVFTSANRRPGSPTNSLMPQ